VSLLFVITPGADWAYAITAGMRHRSVVPAVSGMLAGHVATTIAVAAGVAAVIARTPNIITALTVIGSSYLIWLGIGTLRHPPVPEEVEGTDASVVEQLATGFGVSGLNPKVFLLFLALLPQFTIPDAVWPVPAQIVTLGMVHVASCAVVYLAVGMSARTILRARPAAARWVSRLSGTAMIVIGIVLISEYVLH
jgi:threonine/homoserine/homoserine lactone efflux protein